MAVPNWRRVGKSFRARDDDICPTCNDGILSRFHMVQRWEREPDEIDYTHAWCDKPPEEIQQDEESVEHGAVTN